MTHVEVGFVERERLDPVGVAGEDFADAVGLLPVEVETHRQKDQLRTKIPRLEGRHGGAAAVFPRLVVAGGEHPAPTAAPDRDGFPGELGTLAHLDGRVETVHVDVDDLAGLRLG